MHDAIDWYTEPKETELEKKVKNIKERYRWLKSNMGESNWGFKTTPHPTVSNHTRWWSMGRI